MGRPPEHDERTGMALLDAEERIVDQQGITALSVRRLADEVGTTTRAVYKCLRIEGGARRRSWQTCLRLARLRDGRDRGGR